MYQENPLLTEGKFGNHLNKVAAKRGVSHTKLQQVRNDMAKYFQLARRNGLKKDGKPVLDAATKKGRSLQRKKYQLHKDEFHKAARDIRDDLIKSKYFN